MIEYTEAKKEATVDNFESAAAELDVYKRQCHTCYDIAYKMHPGKNS